MAITNITEALDALKDLAEGLPAAVSVDDTLSVEGAAADAKAVGEAIVDIGELVNTHTNQINEIGIKHMGNYSNPHNVTAAQVATASGKTVEEALEVPYFDLVAMGLPDIIESPDTPITLNDADAAAIVAAAEENGIAQFNMLSSGTEIMCTMFAAKNPSFYIFSQTVDFEGTTVVLDGTTLFVGCITFAQYNHTQAASTITAGTFAGQVVANSTAQTPATMLLRNSKLVTTETNPTVNGEIVWQYS